MSDTRSYMRHGHSAAQSYISGDLAVATFIKEAFQAKELERSVRADGMHRIEWQIGDSIVVLKASDNWPNPRPTGATFVFVPDVDATYARAMAAGGTSLAPPEDKGMVTGPAGGSGAKAYPRRICSVKDGYGNLWKIATYKG